MARKYKTTLYYSVENCGDGSAYPRFFESMELAEWDQENMDEGWGESCTGTIEIESDSPIFVKKEIKTKGSMIKNLEEELSYTSEPYKRNIEKKIESLEEL